MSAFAIPSVPDVTFKVALKYGGKFLHITAYHDEPNPPYRIDGGTLMGAGGGRSEAIPTDLEPTTPSNVAHFIFRTVPGYTFSAQFFTKERDLPPKPDRDRPRDSWGQGKIGAHWIDIDMHNDETGQMTRVVGVSMGGPWDDNEEKQAP